MPAQPNQPPVRNLTRMPIPVISQTNSTRHAPTQTTKSDTTSKLASAPVASLEISDVGREMAAHLNHKITNTADAKQQIEVIHEQLKANPEIGESLHSNLRALRINNLIYD